LPDIGASLAAPAEVFQGEPRSIETFFVRPGGERVWRRIHFFPWHDDDGKLAFVVGQVSSRPDSAGSPQPPHLELHAELLRLRERLYRRYGFERIVGTTDSMRRVLDQVRLASSCDANVLVWGERGTGRKLVARTIHRESARRDGPFIPLDCALLPPDVLERDLFGSDDRGESGPARGRAGLALRAAGGTLFLDNVRHLARDLQSRLVSLCCSAGGAEPTSRAGPLRGVRIISAERTDPLAALAAGEFRADLFFSLSTLVIYLPPLRHRAADLPLLAQHFVESLNDARVKQVSGISLAALNVLQSYEWPNNIRELEEVLRAAVDRCRSHLIEPDDIEARIKGALGGASSPTAVEEAVDLDQMLEREERKMIERAIKKARGNKSQAAEYLGISRPRLYRRMQQLGMDDAEPAETVETPTASPDFTAQHDSQS